MAEMCNKSRVIFPRGKQRKFLENVENTLRESRSSLIGQIKVHDRTYRDWKRECYSMPYYAVEYLCKKTKISFPQNVQIKDPYWYTSVGASKGGKNVFLKYGRVGGSERKRKEKWHKWWDETGRFADNPIFRRNAISIPPYSDKLAEFIGILLGDGSISQRQVRVSLHEIDDKEYIKYVEELAEILFNVPTVTTKRKYSVAKDITISRVNLVDFLTNMGLVVGDKVKKQVKVPTWILEKQPFRNSCLRGLVDTDGSFYVDKHHYKGKEYKNGGLAFSNHSYPLLDFVYKQMQLNGLHPTWKSKYSILLRRSEEIDRYFNIIGSSNKKHVRRYKEYVNMRKSGGVPKRS